MSVLVSDIRKVNPSAVDVKLTRETLALYCVKTRPEVLRKVADLPALAAKTESRGKEKSDSEDEDQEEQPGKDPKESSNPLQRISSQSCTPAVQPTGTRKDADTANLLDARAANRAKPIVTGHTVAPEEWRTVQPRKKRQKHVLDQRARTTTLSAVKPERDYFRRISFNLSLDQLRDQPHKWWSVAKKACGLKHNEAIPSLISADQRISTSPVEKAECLNSSFSEQCNASSPADLPNCTPRSECRFSFKMIEPLDVLKKLASLNSWKAPGIDGVCNRLLKQCAASLAGPLCHVFNTSLEEGKFPDKWKNAVIQPIFKQKGSRSNPKNYRPIALLPCMSKIFEHFVHQQLLEYCLSCDAIPDDQYGFLPGRSTTWQLLTVLDEWERHLDHGNGIHACFLDIAKAFDRVDHPSLLKKLDSLGIRDKEKVWFKSYLFDRSICTRVECAQSQPQPISSGVPQGSVLGPYFCCSLSYFCGIFQMLSEMGSTVAALFLPMTL